MINHVITVIAAAVLAALVVVFVDIHSHRCRTCGGRWRHAGLFSGGSVHEPRARRAHTCKCGDQTWSRYR